MTHSQGGSRPLSSAPVVTVVVASDFAEGPEKSWKDERAALRALANQDIGAAFEVLLVEHEAHRDSIPPDIWTAFPGIRLAFTAATRSAELKDEGARRARAGFVALLEADCVPAPDWLRLMVCALQAHPEVAAVSGKTLYADRGLLGRCLGLIDRSYLDPGGSGPTDGVSNNSAIFRRDMLCRFPYPPSSSPFVSAAGRLKRMQEAGFRFFFESRAIVYHAFPRWRFVRDMRRQTGYTLAVHGRRGLLTNLLILGCNLLSSWHRSVRLHRHYGVRWWELPVALTLSLVVRLYELEGIRYARQGRSTVPDTGYR